MTLATRNVVLIAGVVLISTVLAAYLAGAYALLYGPLSDRSFVVGEYQSWFGVRWPVTQVGAFHSLGAAGVLALIATVVLAVSAHLFRRVSAAEIYFVMLFLMSLAVELFRLGMPLADAAGLPALVGVQLTRIVLFGRLMGALSLFAAGIYLAGADYPRVGSATLLLAAISFLVVYLVPVDSRETNATFLHVVGDRAAIDFLLAFLSVGAIANCSIGWFRGHRERGGAIALSISAIVIGKDLALNLASPLALALGVGLVASGAAAFVLVNRSSYLWY